MITLAIIVVSVLAATLGAALFAPDAIEWLKGRKS